ncbi:fibulin-7-like [Petaurus breviceps papuanus]|uniref:fibulin-7-like n=1 Tax=Petaurus breviceps papuanus TaxID=3040969 RepID=UPI0036DF6FD9
MLGLLFLMALCLLQVPLSDGQGCLSKRSVLATIRQMQKLLSTQEAAQLQGLRSLRKQLTLLQGNVHKQATRRNETCPHLAMLTHGRKLGRKVGIGHEVHFLCDAGFQLVGSETRLCQENRTWSGQQPFCKSIDDCASQPCTNGGTCVDDVQRYVCLCPSGWTGSNCQTPATSCECPHLLCTCRTIPREPAHFYPSKRGQETASPRGNAVIKTQAGARERPDWVSLSNSSFSRQPRCAENGQGARQCSCDVGFQMRAGGLCQAHQEEGLRRGVLTASPSPSSQCERNPCPVDSQACRQAANSISFHYLPLPSNRTVPRVLFRMSTTRFLGDSLRFAITGGRGLGAFAVQRSDRHTGELVLTSPVPGPATLEVQLEMSELSKKVLLGKHIFRITAFISPYEF